MLDINALPTDVTQLQRLLIEHHALVATQTVDLRTKQRQIEHLKFQLAKLRRFRFGQSSERLEGIEQMDLSLEALEASVATAQVPTPTLPKPSCPRKVRRSGVNSCPSTSSGSTTRSTRTNAPARTAAARSACLGADTAEVLEARTVTFTVTRHIRPKKRCSTCSVIVQAPAPARPIEKSFAGASLLALVLELEVCVPPAAVSSMPDICPCGADDQPHDAHAVGWREQRVVRTVGRGTREARVGGAQYQRG